MSKWMSKIMGPYSGSGQMCASAWFFERFSQGVRWWCPLDYAFYSFDRGSVERQKNQAEHHLHDFMIFFANRGLTSYIQDVWGQCCESQFLSVFSTTSRARICMIFQTDFEGRQLVVSSGLCIRIWVRSALLQKKNRNYSKFWSKN